MARQQIHQIRAAGLGQIPGATFDTGAAAGLTSLAKTFDGIADRLADREDKAVEREGAKAGALAGSKGAFARQDDATIRGEAFNIAATTTFQQTTSAKVKVRLAEFEKEFANNSAGYSNAVKAYSAGVVAEVQSVAPEVAEIFSQEIDLRRSQGESRIFKTEQANQTDAARSAALLTLRSISEDAALAGQQVDFNDPASVTEYFAGLDKRRAEFRASMMGTGPTGPLFTAEQRTKALLEFQDDETETAVMAQFNNILNQPEDTDGATALEVLKSFTDGDDVKVEIIDAETGEKVVKTVAIRDELRADIVKRMRSALKAQRAEITFQRTTADRERNKRQATANANLDLAISRSEANENHVEQAHRRGEISDTQRVDRIKQIDTRDKARIARTAAAEKVTATTAKAELTLKRGEANAALDLAIAEEDMNAAGVKAARKAGLLTGAQETARLKQIITRDKALEKGELKDEADVVKMKRTEADARLNVGIARGTVNENMIEAAHKAGLLTEPQRTARIKQFLTKNSDAADRIHGIRRVQSQQGHFDPKIKQDRDDVDAAWEDVVAPALAESDPALFAPGVIEYVKSVGIVPTAVKQMIHGSLRQGPSAGRENSEELIQDKVAAADMLGRLVATTPAVLKDFTTEERDLGLAINSLVKAGVPAAEAVLRAEELRDVPESTRIERGRKVTADDHLEKNDEFLDTQFPDGALGDGFVGEFNDIQARAFMRTGDLTASQEIAAADMRRVWALTGVGSADGDLRMMKYAPERFGPMTDPAANTEWMQKQFLDDIKKMNLPGADSGTGPVLAPDPDALPGAGSSPGSAGSLEAEFSIIADDQTAREAGGGSPSYLIRRLVNGAMRPIFDEEGGAFRWRSDWQSTPEKAAKDAEIAEGLAAAREKRAINSDINEDVRKTMDGINSMRDRLGQRLGVHNEGAFNADN